ncbi:MAG: hypothetical protein HWN80_16730, partial [Candidatus Lokiarchaeota archaeon]|nr:hypothetical protein [Candidatus Lokiarchaeota archaeon]
AIYINSTTIEIRIEEQRVSWDIYFHHVSTWNEMYKGKNECGKITVHISKKGCAFACGRKVFFMGYEV